jgi:hypothetical protein
LILNLPCERYDTPYEPHNIDQHLYTWSPLNLGNLVHAAGFDVELCRWVGFRFPPKPHLFYRGLGPKVFHIISRAYGSLATRLSQVHLVARRD